MNLMSMHRHCKPLLLVGSCAVTVPTPLYGTHALSCKHCSLSRIRPSFTHACADHQATLRRDAENTAILGLLRPCLEPRLILSFSGMRRELSVSDADRSSSCR